MDKAEDAVCHDDGFVSITPTGYAGSFVVGNMVAGSCPDFSDIGY